MYNNAASSTFTPDLRFLAIVTILGCFALKVGLDAAGRAIVHTRCEELGGLAHHSDGIGADRAVLVSRCA
jgi:hypothetical protein